MNQITKSNRKRTDIEFVIAIGYVLIWLVIYALPYFQNRVFNVVLWEKVISEWITISALMLLFFLNVYVLVPKLLFPKKYLVYLLAAVTIMTLFIGSAVWCQLSFIARNPVQMPPMEIGPGLPPMELSASMPAPMGFKVGHEALQKSPLMLFVDYFIIGFLVVASGSTMQIIMRWIKEETKRKDVEKIQLKTELALLRHQVNPHFLMNTLNNIHALMDIDVDKSKDAVIKLSTLMRYLLYDSSKGKTSLLKEMDFIRSYIALMQLRYSEDVEILIEIPDDLPDAEIPPLLFISFIENAFKHGVSYRHKSFVEFRITAENKLVSCLIKNSKHSTQSTGNSNYSGIGMENVKRSLELLYQHDYSLDIVENDKVYEVRLAVPI